MIPATPTSWKKRVFTDFRRHRRARTDVARVCRRRRAICRAFRDPPRARGVPALTRCSISRSNVLIVVAVATCGRSHHREGTRLYATVDYSRIPSRATYFGGDLTSIVVLKRRIRDYGIIQRDSRDWMYYVYVSWRHFRSSRIVTRIF